MPSLTDPTFAGTVVYVLDHSDTGTLGVVLGRPSQVEIRDVLPGWCDLAVEPGRVPRGRPVRDRHRAVPGHRARGASPTRTARCGAWPATSTWSTSTPTRPTCPSSSPACGSSPATPAGPPASWPARSPRAPGRACPGRPDDVLSARGRAGAVAGGHGPPDRPARRALHRAGGSDCQLRVPGSLRHLVGRTRERAVWGRGRPLPLSSARCTARPRGAVSQTPNAAARSGMVGRLRRLLVGAGTVERARRRGRTASPSRRPSPSGQRGRRTGSAGRRRRRRRPCGRPAGRTARSAGCRSSAAPARCSRRRGRTAGRRRCGEDRFEQHLEQHVEQRRRRPRRRRSSGRCR